MQADSRHDSSQLHCTPWQVDSPSRQGLRTASQVLKVASSSHIAAQCLPSSVTTRASSESSPLMQRNQVILGSSATQSFKQPHPQ